MVRSRRKARRLVLQALYEADAVGHGAESVLERFLAEGDLDDENAAFARDMVKGVVQHKAAIDRHIRTHATSWPVSQIPPIDRNVLRLAIFEIIIDNRTPVRVGINEAVELAKAFGSDSSPKFINGVLGSIVLKLKDSESVQS
jgi:N utilization substance protein B